VAAGEPARPGTPASAKIPAIDYERVEIVEGKLDMVAEKPDASAHGGGGGGSVPSLHKEEENRRVGRRGEKIAFHKERERLQTIGKNPDLAVWISKDRELAPFDIQSVDDDDQVIYIEVKATRADDPSEQFYISGPELLHAALHRSRYFIYRVTETDTSTPRITRIADPLQEIKDGRGRLQLSTAQMTLSVSKSGD
jgi:hypothetical protein